MPDCIHWRHVDISLCKAGPAISQSQTVRARQCSQEQRSRVRQESSIQESRDGANGWIRTLLCQLRLAV